MRKNFIYDYNITSGELNYILNKYGSVENFYHRFVFDKDFDNTEEKDIEIGNKIFKIAYNIDEGPSNNNYDTLVSEILGIYRTEELYESLNRDHLYVYSKEKLDEILNNELSELQRGVIKSRYGLEDQHYLSYPKISEKYNITQSKVRNLESNVYRRLRGNSRKYVKVIDLSYDEFDVNSVINVDSKLRYGNNESDDSENYKKVIRNYISKTDEEEEKRRIEEEKRKETLFSPIDTPVSELKLSTRLKRILMGNDIKTIKEIILIEEPKKLRGLGNNTYEELKNIVHGFGFKLYDELNDEEIKKLEEQLMEDYQEKAKIKLLDEYKSLLKEKERLHIIESRLDNDIAKLKNKFKELGLKYDE